MLMAVEIIRIAPADTNTSSYNNVIVNVDNISVTAPASLFSGAIGSDSSSWLVAVAKPNCSPNADKYGSRSAEQRSNAGCSA